MGPSPLFENHALQTSERTRFSALMCGERNAASSSFLKAAEFNLPQSDFTSQFPHMPDSHCDV